MTDRFSLLKAQGQKKNVPENCREIISSLPKGQGWAAEHIYLYQGFWFDPVILEGVIWAQQSFRAIDTDIFLASSPKCGTTWLKALMFTIANRKRYDSSSQSHPLLTTSPHDCIPTLEILLDHDDPIAYLESLPSSPRLISTHLSYTSLPNSILNADSGSRIVYITRNPKDALVSLWVFSKAIRSENWNHLPPLPIQEACDLFCEGVSFAGPFWDHVLGYWKASLETPNKVLFLKYEDMKMDTQCWVKRLADFMGHSFSLEEERQGVVQEIIKLCSFQNLTSLEVNKRAGNKEFFRRGEVGDSKNHLTPQMIKRLEEITEQKLATSGLKF
ncbi:hypothetical protein M0R45_023408 [Rubus argutus]|uniref:Sulfotransferase n=1 Tax=Rubus argutus TaxID=59490 RepID=A0AAW1WPP0_RUBAR